MLSSVRRLPPPYIEGMTATFALVTVFLAVFLPTLALLIAGLAVLAGSPARPVLGAD